MSVNEDSNLNGLLSVYLKCEKDLSPYLKKNLFQSECVLPFSLELAASLYSRPLRT